MSFATSTKIAALALAGLSLVSITEPARAGNNTGAAIAAGVATGLIVGGIAAAAANDRYGPPPPRAYGPGYGPRPAYGYGYGRPRPPRCWMETQTFYNRYGRPYHRSVEVCR